MSLGVAFSCTFRICQYQRSDCFLYGEVPAKRHQVAASIAESRLSYAVQARLFLVLDVLRLELISLQYLLITLC